MQCRADHSRTALKTSVPPENVAKAILFLASENWSGSITGQVVNVDSGKQGKGNVDEKRVLKPNGELPSILTEPPKMDE